VVLRKLLQRRSSKKIRVVATYTGRIVDNGQVIDVQGHFDSDQAEGRQPGRAPRELEE
jgi:hypothetical protein